MRWIAVTLAVTAWGCGGGGTAAAPPRLPHVLGSDLAARAGAIEASLAAGDACGAAAEAAQLREAVARAVASGQVPEALRAPLTRSVDSLSGEIVCVPAPAPKPGTGPKPVPPGQRPGHDHGPGRDHGPKHDHRPKHDHGDGGND